MRTDAETLYGQSRPRRVLVCGGRDFEDESHVFNSLSEFENEYGEISCLIHGGATGADTLAAEYAHRERRRVAVYRANWKRFGKRAGPMRNAKMLEDGKPDIVIAFADGRGTENMISLALAVGIPVIRR